MCNVVVRLHPKLIYFPSHNTLEYQGPTKSMKLLLRGKKETHTFKMLQMLASTATVFLILKVFMSLLS